MMGGMKKMFWGSDWTPSPSYQLFNSLKGDKPEMPDPLPAPPTVDDAKSNQEEQDSRRRRRGVAATILTSPSGTRSSGKLGRPTLLGS